MYRPRSETERQFCRLKGFLRVFSRFKKLDAVFRGFTMVALGVNALRQC